jgi:endonuclease-8
LEGPSIVIACEELKPFLKRPLVSAKGTVALPLAPFKGGRLLRVRSWGKHLLLIFSHTNLRIHFLMFGSYRIDDPRKNRVPKLLLNYGDSKIYFYSCAIKAQPPGFERDYDWSVDLMSPQWDARQAVARLREKPDRLVCDVLMDQDIFSGLGNIMKNEILFTLHLHPETAVRQLSAPRLRKLVAEAERYAWQFYEWKKANVLKRNWKIMRKKKCPLCHRAVKKRVTGKLQRWSHYCTHCQVKA